MKKSNPLPLAILVGLTLATTSFGWHYEETRYYSAPVIVERVYTPPVVRYEPRVVERTSCFGNDWFSVSTTRSNVVYDTVIQSPCRQTVICEPPAVVNRIYESPCRRDRVYVETKRPKTTVIVRPKCERRRTYVVKHHRPDRKVIVIKKRPERKRRIRIKFDR